MIAFVALDCLCTNPREADHPVLSQHPHLALFSTYSAWKDRQKSDDHSFGFRSCTQPLDSWKRQMYLPLHTSLLSTSLVVGQKLICCRQDGQTDARDHLKRTDGRRDFCTQAKQSSVRAIEPGAFRVCRMKSISASSEGGRFALSWILVPRSGE